MHRSINSNCSLKTLKKARLPVSPRQRIGRQANLVRSGGSRFAGRCGASAARGDHPYAG